MEVAHLERFDTHVCQPRCSVFLQVPVATFFFGRSSLEPAQDNQWQSRLSRKSAKPPCSISGRSLSVYSTSFSKLFFKHRMSHFFQLIIAPRRAEILLTAHLRHPNIVQFVGACWGRELMCLVLEWAEKVRIYLLAPIFCSVLLNKLFTCWCFGNRAHLLVFSMILQRTL